MGHKMKHKKSGEREKPFFSFNFFNNLFLSKLVKKTLDGSQGGLLSSCYDSSGQVVTSN